MSDLRLVEVKSCPLCGAFGRTTRFVEAPFAVLRCDACALVYVSPRVHDEQLAEVYGEGYWRSDSPKTRGYADYAAEEELYVKTFRRRLAALPAVREGALRVLDVGCAAGYFLRVMGELGHDVRGVELSPQIAATAVARIGAAQIFVGTLAELPADHPGFEPGTFDLVTMWDVVEHVADPRSLLRAAKAMLAPGGRLVLETQNVESIFARLLGRRWHHYKHQEHLLHFGPRTISRLLEQAGFEVERNTVAYGGKYVSLAFVAERAGRLHPLLGPVLKPLTRLRGLNAYVNLCDEMIVTARPQRLLQQRPGVDAATARSAQT